jgi:hypothetical protein
MKNSERVDSGNFMGGEISIDMNDNNSQEKPDSETSTNLNEFGLREIYDYNRFSQIINDTYMGPMTYYSITLDLIALYLKGQKLLYVESKTFCEQCLYFLMLPAIFISACCTVLSMALKDISYGSLIVSGLTGVNSFILSVVTYLKLDAKSEAHKTSAYQFDKLQTVCEFYSGKTLMIKDQKMREKVTEFIDSVEKKVDEIKDVNQFIIPEIIRHRYSTIYSYNVFSIMKKYKTIRILNTQKLLNVVKKIEINLNSNGNDALYAERDRLINEIIEYRNISINMNEDFNKEINKYVNNKTSQFLDICSWLKT